MKTIILELGPSHVAKLASIVWSTGMTQEDAILRAIIDNDKLAHWTLGEHCVDDFDDRDALVVDRHYRGQTGLYRVVRIEMRHPNSPGQLGICTDYIRIEALARSAREAQTRWFQE